MIPQFKIKEGNFAVRGCDVELRRHASCECGKVATILATFAIVRLKSDNDGRNKISFGALLLCSDCAIDMLEEDRQSWRNDFRCNLVHFMGIGDAFVMAEETTKEEQEAAEATEAKPPRRYNNKAGNISLKWRSILEWIGQSGEVSIKDVASRYKLKEDNVSNRLNTFVRRKFLEKELRSGRKYFRPAQQKAA